VPGQVLYGVGFSDTLLARNCENPGFSSVTDTVLNPVE
jgi:hypothetical protein